MITFEVQSYKNSWKLISTHDDEKDAIYSARELLKGNRHTSVRVIKETYDPETDRDIVKVVYSKRKMEDKRGHGGGSDKAQGFWDAADSRDTDDDDDYDDDDWYDDDERPRRKKKSSPMGALVKVILGLGVTLILIIGVMYMLLEVTGK